MVRVTMRHFNRDKTLAIQIFIFFLIPIDDEGSSDFAVLISET